jgi:hypothetical protein
MTDYLEIAKNAKVPAKEAKEAKEALGVEQPPAAVANIDAARTRSWDKDERRLLAAGWEPKERCGPLGLTIWANPGTGFYCSREVALRRMDERSGA